MFKSKITSIIPTLCLLFSVWVNLFATSTGQTGHNADSSKVIEILSQIRQKYSYDKTFGTDDSLSVIMAIRLARQSNFISGEAQCYDVLGVRERNRSNYSKALEYHQKALDIIADLPIYRDKAIILNNIGVIYRRLDDFKRAADYHLMALEIAEKINDIPTRSISINSLGNIFLAQHKYSDALSYFHEALEIETQRNNLLGIAINLNNIGNVYEEQKLYHLAIEYYNKSIAANTKLGSDKGIAICYNGLGEIYIIQNRTLLALEYFEKALAITEKIGDKIYSAGNHVGLGKAYSKMTNYPKAIAHFTKALEIAQSIGSKNHAQLAYDGLSRTYETSGEIKKALEFYKKANALKDSIYNEVNSSYINRSQILYESGKKDKEIELLKYKQMVSSKKQKIIVGSLIIGCSFLVILLLLLVYNSRLKQQANTALLQYNKDIEEKNHSLIQTKEEILAQRDEIEMKSNQINEAYELIKIKNNNITDNIRYAVQIQNSLLPDLSQIKKYLPHTFIFHKPKDIVSGDFYWVAQNAGKTIVAAADCTGHGVTGAFMSILGIYALNEIVVEKGITQPNNILNLLREKIIATLQQGGEFSESREGIHMAICTFDFQKMEMQFSGAINSIILIRNGETIQFKGDKMPISIFPEMGDYTTVNIPLHKNDMFYLFSDGYYGQFGGNDDKKFSIYRFRNLLQKISTMPIPEQQKTLENTLESWKGDSEQVDDILVMGIKI